MLKKTIISVFITFFFSFLLSFAHTNKSYTISNYTYRDTLTTKTIEFEVKKGKSNIHLNFMVPVKGTTLLLDSINFHLYKTLLIPFFDVDIIHSASSESFPVFNKEVIHKNPNAFKAIAKDCLNKQIDDEYQTNYSVEAKVINNSKQVVTYLISGMTTHDLHRGLEVWEFVTFDATTGKKITYSDLFASEKMSELTSLVKEETIKQHFECLPTELPASVRIEKLPFSTPAITKKGIMFYYIPLEIAPRHCNVPSCTITFEQVKPFLSKEGLKLLSDIFPEQ